MSFPYAKEAAIHARVRAARHAVHICDDCADPEKRRELPDDHPAPHELDALPYDEHLTFTDKRGKVDRHYHPDGGTVTPIVVGPHDWAAYEADPLTYQPEYLRFDETVTKPKKG